MRRAHSYRVAALGLVACQRASVVTGDPAAATPAAVPSPAPSPSASARPAERPSTAPPATTIGADGAAPWSWSFDVDRTGAPPTGFSFARTGGGKYGRWIVQAAEDARSSPNVLVQADADVTDDRFPVALVEASTFKDVALSVACKPIAGAVDRACGLVWRYAGVNDYYLARANALEDNVRLYRVTDGKRIQLASSSVRVASGIWHTLRVEARGDRFQVSFDGARLLDAHDAAIRDAGRIGVWTKADSVTQFDDLTAGAL